MKERESWFSAAYKSQLDKFPVSHQREKRQKTIQENQYLNLFALLVEGEDGFKGGDRFQFDCVLFCSV